MIAHVCQDRFGFWFTSIEDDDGSLSLHTHAATREDALEEATRSGAREIKIGPTSMSFPEGGLAPGYTPPEPAKVD